MQIDALAGGDLLLGARDERPVNKGWHIDRLLQELALDQEGDDALRRRNLRSVDGEIERCDLLERRLQLAVGETAAPRRRQEGRYSRARSIWRKPAGEPPFAVEAEDDFGRGVSSACADSQAVGTVGAPAQHAVEENGVGRPGEFGKVAHQFTA